MARSAKDRAYSHVKDLIIGNELPEGGFLTENQIASDLGISRTPVREAFLRLEAENLIQLVPQKGAFVPPISDRDVEEAMEARQLIEVHCAQKLARDGTSIAPTLADLLDEQEGLTDDVEAFIACDRRFHARIVGAAGNTMLTRLYEGLRDRQLRMGIKAVVTGRDRARQVIDEHRAIAEAIDQGNPEATRAAIEEHLHETLMTLRSKRRI